MSCSVLLGINKVNLSVFYQYKFLTGYFENFGAQISHDFIILITTNSIRGGAFGGKETRSIVAALPAAVAAHK